MKTIPSQTEILRFFSEQLSVWQEANDRFQTLNQEVQTHLLQGKTYCLKAQFNPARIVSASAKVDTSSLLARPCFLCEGNRPSIQNKLTLPYGLELLVNPFPIFPFHFTIPTQNHLPQSIKMLSTALTEFASAWDTLIVFYNGPRCGASAPDHAHLQAGSKGVLPIEKHWLSYEKENTRVYPQTKLQIAATQVLPSTSERSGIYRLNGFPANAFVVIDLPLSVLLDQLPVESPMEEPDVNIITWKQHYENEESSLISIVFPRKKHRPDCYYSQDTTQCLVSPGALDMGGLLITPRKEDFGTLTTEVACTILKEVSLTDDEMEDIEAKLLSFAPPIPLLSVGIMQAKELRCIFNGSFLNNGEAVSGEMIFSCENNQILWRGKHYASLHFKPTSSLNTFKLLNVPIGIDFHWEQKQNQSFSGNLKIIPKKDTLIVVNEVGVENYLKSVISSEMRATSSPSLLRAHAVVSRSWVYAQILSKFSNAQTEEAGAASESEIVRWYDKSQHLDFDVCADDHCQRYQGIPITNSGAIEAAINETQGIVLMHDGKLCDARFSKCCGGVTEAFSTCWQNRDYAYLTVKQDNLKNDPSTIDLSNEDAAAAWILNPKPAFCNTDDKELLRQVLNDYDQQTANFYRWQITYSQAELSALISTKIGKDFGDILDLQPLQRGIGGRLIKLKIIGTKRSLILGKELEIRRALSPSHLYSAAFIIEKGELSMNVPQSFTLKGAGWGHGVGMCQIGAAAMSTEGYTYQEIITHYYPNTALSKIWK